jgi:hypothetical protein
MIVSLSGAAGVFGYWLPLGGSSIQIPSGPYTFTSVACLSESGTIKASYAPYNRPWIWTWTCESVTLSPSVE